jgi:uridylate kinase
MTSTTRSTKEELAINLCEKEKKLPVIVGGGTIFRGLIMVCN